MSINGDMLISTFAIRVLRGFRIFRAIALGMRGYWIAAASPAQVLC